MSLPERTSKRTWHKKNIRKVLFYIFKLLPGNFFPKRFDRIAKQNDFESSNIIANSIFGYGRKEEMPGNLFDEFVDVDFEGRKYKSVKDYHTYLSNIFGDYMQLPPKEMQVAKHDFEAYYK
ncbi:LPS biosynthesis protein [Treponema sp. JC4]|nr:LPS biosynthesis protein [Treponema sp. JC4]